MGDAVLVETTHGRVRGRRAGPVSSFKGIPYARAPLGSLRFQPPRPSDPWPGELDATRYGPIARQTVSPMELIWGADQSPQSEDCLSVNLWTPGPDNGRRPVMVWFHGGAFVTGSGATPWYDGTSFARSGDVVVVTFNYRLGAFGFLHLGEVAGEAYAASGNVGLLDQVAALQWVRDNVGAFGGDPGNVTVFGESAGAMSLGCLIGMPAAKGLFGRAVLQSGACAHTISREQAAGITRRLLARLDLSPTSPSTMEVLAELPAAALLGAQDGLGAGHPDGLAFVPVVDGVILPGPPLDAVAGGAASNLDLMVGTNLEEMRLYTVMDPKLADLDEAELVARADEVWGRGSGRAAVAVYRRRLPDASVSELWTAMATDKVFRIPAIRLAEAQSVAQSAVQAGTRSSQPVAPGPGYAGAHGGGHATFMYLFSWRTPTLGGVLGSCHALEIPFVFANLDKPGAALFTGEGPDRAELARNMQAAWVAIARQGRPRLPGAEAWRPYDVERRSTMVLSAASVVVDDPGGEERRLWAGVKG